MHPILAEHTKPFPRTNRLRDDIRSFLSVNGCEKTAEHCMDVGTEARRIALRFGADPEAAETSGWLHDISAVIPNGDRIAVSRELGIEVLPEEEAFPIIVHQKLSVVMAQQLFGVTDTVILDAVGCHTTLRRAPPCSIKCCSSRIKSHGINPAHRRISASCRSN
nr:HD domain-containing protein [Paenibacillus elgii]